MIEHEVHRKLAASLFNHTWELIELPARTVEQDDEMVHSAHASRYHWGIVGQPKNFARGEWQISRVYALLGRAEPAIYHGSRCLQHCEAHGLSAFDHGFAHEALARGYALTGDAQAFEKHKAAASSYLEQVVKEPDRSFLANDLATLTLTDQSSLNRSERLAKVAPG